MSLPVRRRAPSKCVVSDWSSKFKKQYGGTLPHSYLSLDLETSGFRRDFDLILEIGHCVVKAGKPVQVAATLIDWTVCDFVDQDWLRDRITNVKQGVEHDKDGNPNGAVFPITYERLSQEGVPYKQAFEFYYDLFAKMRDKCGYYVGQNFYAFDAEFLANAFGEFLGKTFDFGPNEVFDVGAIEKATQMQILPEDEDTLQTYFRRVAGTRKAGVKWSISHCMEKYGIAERYEIPKTSLHSAGTDSLCAALTFETFRELSNENIRGD